MARPPRQSTRKKRKSGQPLFHAPCSPSAAAPSPAATLRTITNQSNTQDRHIEAPAQARAGKNCNQTGGGRQQRRAAAISGQRAAGDWEKQSRGSCKSAGGGSGSFGSELLYFHERPNERNEALSQGAFSGPRHDHPLVRIISFNAERPARTG